MWPFPKCSFEVLLSGGVFTAGQHVDGALVVTAEETIRGADHIELVFRTIAWAAYAAGQSRQVARRVVFEAPFRVQLPDAVLPAGVQRYPFAIDVPAWLPPGYRGADCAIEHEIATRVEVHWARDPKAKVYPTMYVPPQRGERRPLNTRSPANFHERVVLEVTLASSVVALGEPLTGQIAMRSGHDARFDAVVLSFASTAKITMGYGDRRQGPPATRVRIAASALRDGQAVPFELPCHEAFLPTFHTSFIDHDLFLFVSLDSPWAGDPSFGVKLHVLPRGSTLVGDAMTSVIGSARVERLGAAMAAATGLSEGHAPTLIEGAVGPVALRIADAPRDSVLGIDVDFTFPNVELGIVFRPLGMFELSGGSPVMPRDLRARYLLRCERDDDASASFLTTLLDDLGNADDIRLSDHHLGLHFLLPNDEPARMVEIARVAQARARVIAEAIGRLSFPTAVIAAQAAWRATAAEQGAFLVPSGPSLHGLSFRARVNDGEERMMGVTIRTVWTKDVPASHVDVDLHHAPLPEAARAALEDEADDRLRAVRATFPSAHALADGVRATLERPEWSADPRDLLPAIEAFFTWVLEVRGERRADAPYR